MAASHLKVVRVMSRSNLYASGTEFLIYISICNNRNQTICQRQLQHFSNQILIALILRVHSNSRISQQSLRTGGGDLYKAALFPCNGIINMPEEAILLLMLNLCIRNRSLTYRTPVNNPGTFINISLLIQLAEHL